MYLHNYFSAHIDYTFSWTASLCKICFLFFWVEFTHNVILVSGMQHSDASSLCYAKLTASVAIICHYITLLQYNWLYSLFCAFSVAYSFHNWKPVSTTPFTHGAHFCIHLPCGSYQSVFYIYMSDLIFVFLFIFFIF